MEVKPELWGAMGSYVSSCGLAAGGLELWLCSTVLKEGKIVRMMFAN